MIYTLGESVYDILFKESIPVVSVHGGSMYNVAVSLGRAGESVAFAGYYADDFIGHKSKKFLQANGVKTGSYYSVPGAKSNLALAFLNEQMIPEYNFYRDDKLNGHSFNLDLKNVDYLVTGSFYAIDNKNYPHIIEMITKARKNKICVLYDPNIRSKHLDKHPELYKRIAKMLELADLVKLSAEDLFHITGSEDKADWQKYMKKHRVNKYILTHGVEPVEVVFEGEHMQIPVPAVEVKSSVGAGDGFTAGFVSYGAKAMENFNDFLLAVERGISFAGAVCKSNENYISEDFWKAS